MRQSAKVESRTSSDTGMSVTHGVTREVDPAPDSVDACRMACLLALFALISPRLALVLVWLFSDG